MLSRSAPGAHRSKSAPPEKSCPGRAKRHRRAIFARFLGRQVGDQHAVSSRRFRRIAANFSSPICKTGLK